MTDLTSNRPPYQIDQITFQEGVVAISYVDPAKVSRTVMVATQVSFNPEIIEDRIEDLMFAICDIVDEVHVIFRNPPERIRPPRTDPVNTES